MTMPFRHPDEVMSLDLNGQRLRWQSWKEMGVGYGL